ncbi:unnamed protein product [Gordionus sp. m RMFG-2023]
MVSTFVIVIINILILIMIIALLALKDCFSVCRKWGNKDKEKKSAPSDAPTDKRALLSSEEIWKDYKVGLTHSLYSIHFDSESGGDTKSKELPEQATSLYAAEEGKVDYENQYLPTVYPAEASTPVEDNEGSYSPTPT